MKDSAISFVAVLLTFICSLTIFAEYAPGAEMIVPLALIGVNTALHLVYATRRRISLALLPAAWASCVAPLYIYCYSIDHYSLYDKRFAFIVLGVIALAPVFAVSLLTSIVSGFMRH